MKLFCIKFERELEGIDVLHYRSKEKPTYEEAVEFIIDQGYVFNKGYDEIRGIWEL